MPRQTTVSEWWRANEKNKNQTIIIKIMKLNKPVNCSLQTHMLTNLECTARTRVMIVESVSKTIIYTDARDLFSSTRSTHLMYTYTCKREHTFLVWLSLFFGFGCFFVCRRFVCIHLGFLNLNHAKVQREFLISWLNHFSFYFDIGLPITITGIFFSIRRYAFTFIPFHLYPLNSRDNTVQKHTSSIRRFIFVSV